MSRLPLVAFALAVAAGLTGCESGSFHAHGAVSSAGPLRKDNWRSTPQGCTRDPFDALPADQSKSILTLLWEEPGRRDPRIDNPWTAPDAPMRLEFSRTDPNSPVTATLHTRYKAGVPLNPQVCSTFHLETRQQSAIAPAPRPSLSGEFALDCQAQGNHITASVRFEGCEY